MASGVLAAIVERKRCDVARRLAGASLDPEPSRRSLGEALARPGARFILEVKRASPSGHRSRRPADEAARSYAPVADAISVLTDEPFFGGSLDDLGQVRKRFDGPLLAKDVIVDERQVTEARAHGADAVLAMLSVLGDERARAVMAEAERLAMDVIVEVHDEVELARALALKAAIIGINNRDLASLETDLAVTERLAARVPADRLLVSESGIGSRADVERLEGQADAFLVGSALMAAADMGEAARALVHGRVKVCGLGAADDVRSAGRCGASHAGFVFVPGTPRSVTEQAAVALAGDARSAGMKTVGVFRDCAPERVERVAGRIGLDAVQLHGRESAGEIARLRRSLDGELWATCGVAERAEPEREGADRTLFDTRVAGRCGGSGRPFDWSLVAGRGDLAGAFLAGGIAPANARAAQRVGAHGIDVGSGIEARPGRKCPERTRALFDALRPAGREQASCA
ncbi:MAG TPA: bifunctional indole-3-glycerol-phosphate synthase TrpC/phosphoribosylanthranilate isomerase TrpF [Sphingomicrobium sp.]|nr:bifunctional indole-3-glycerol-phosphate synthase TrpC/phosphoribosylanthranilate isomerase TrpF [Sphingomicrobium sp.]